MRRDTKDRLLGFSTSFGITFLAMIVVLGTICLLFYYNLRGEEAAPHQPTVYLPTQEDRLTLLVAGSEEKGVAPDVFLCLGFLPDKGKIAICMLPPATYVEYGGQGSTLARLWEQGGITYAQKALAQYLDIPIQRYAGAEVEDLSRLMAYGGLLNYYLPVDLNYPLHGRQIVMPKGNYQLDGRKAADIMAYPAYKGGELERSDRGGMLVSQIITANLPAFLSDVGDRLTATALDCLDTDLSATDCQQRRPALEFLAKLRLPATTTVFLEGSFSRDYTVFHLTDDCKSRIREMYQPPKEEPPQPGQEETSPPTTQGGSSAAQSQEAEPSSPAAQERKNNRYVKFA